MKTLGICSMVRNEAPYIAEWIAFHRLVGVSRFHIYDDRSTDGTPEIAKRVGGDAVVIHTYDEGWDDPQYNGIPMHIQWHATTQCHAFTHYSTHLYRETYWCAFLDPDEFLFHTEIDSLPIALGPYEPGGGLVVPWLVFGASSHKTRPEGLTIEAYTRRGRPGQPEPWGRHVKTVVNMECAPRWGTHGSHTPVLGMGRQVHEYHTPSPWSMVHLAFLGKFRLNHYYHRSYEEAEAKLTRGYSTGPVGYPGRERLEAHDRNEIEDTAILRFAKKLKQVMP